MPALGRLLAIVPNTSLAVSAFASAPLQSLIIWCNVLIKPRRRRRLERIFERSGLTVRPPVEAVKKTIQLLPSSLWQDDRTPSDSDARVGLGSVDLHW